MGDQQKNTLKKLYKMSATGKISQWEIESKSDCYIIQHGYIDGKQQEQIQYLDSGKNIGKANETSVAIQCELEAKSRWQKQKDRKGYTEDIPKNKPLRPMLAKSYNKPGTDFTNLKDGKHIVFPCLWQPKLDGCVSGCSLIKTKQHGYRTIKWIVDNKIDCLVLTMNKNGRLEYKQVTDYFRNSVVSQDEQWYELELETGEILTITGNHEVYLPDLKCWRRADCLDGTEKLMVI